MNRLWPQLRDFSKLGRFSLQGSCAVFLIIWWSLRYTCKSLYSCKYFRFYYEEFLNRTSMVMPQTNSFRTRFICVWTCELFYIYVILKLLWLPTHFLMRKTPILPVGYVPSLYQPSLYWLVAILRSGCRKKRKRRIQSSIENKNSLCIILLTSWGSWSFWNDLYFRGFSSGWMLHFKKYTKAPCYWKLKI